MQPLCMWPVLILEMVVKTPCSSTTSGNRQASCSGPRVARRQGSKQTSSSCCPTLAMWSSRMSRGSAQLLPTFLWPNTNQLCVWHLCVWQKGHRHWRHSQHDKEQAKPVAAHPPGAACCSRRAIPRPTEVWWVPRSHLPGDSHRLSIPKSSSKSSTLHAWWRSRCRSPSQPQNQQPPKRKQQLFILLPGSRHWPPCCLLVSFKAAPASDDCPHHYGQILGGNNCSSHSSRRGRVLCMPHY